MGQLVYLGLGSNLGHKIENLKLAAAELEATPEITLTRYSSLYKTEPWGKTNQDFFINQVVALETDLSPSQLLETTQNIEIKMGRRRLEKWGPRVIDIDLLLYGDQIVDLLDLKVPHPYMRERLFVLVPLAEISPDLVFPEDGTPIREVLVRELERGNTNQILKI